MANLAIQLSYKNNERSIKNLLLKNDTVFNDIFTILKIIVSHLSDNIFKNETMNHQ